MLPDFPSNDCVDCSRGDIELSAQCFKSSIFTGYISRPNIPNNRFGNNSHRMVFSAIIMSHVLSIPHVISGRSSVKMCRVYARWIMTAVKDIKTFWNGSVRLTPRNLVCWSYSRFAVSVFVRWSFPNPARLCFCYSCPKSYEGAGAIFSVVALLRAEIALASGPPKKGNAAGLANTWYFGNSQGRSLLDRFQFWLGSLYCSISTWAVPYFSMA